MAETQRLWLPAPGMERHSVDRDMTSQLSVWRKWGKVGGNLQVGASPPGAPSLTLSLAANLSRSSYTGR